MELNDFQKQCMSTCTDSSKNMMYMLFGLQAEVGEVADKIAKGIRKEEISVYSNQLHPSNSVYENESMFAAQELGLKAEVADCAWFIAGICEVMGWQMQDLADLLKDKLNSRKERGVIVGNGDNR